MLSACDSGHNELELVFRGNSAERFNKRLGDDDVWGLAKGMFHLAKKEFELSDEQPKSVDLTASLILKGLSSDEQRRDSPFRESPSLKMKTFDKSLATISEQKPKQGSGSELLNELTEEGDFKLEHWLFTNLFKIDLGHNFLGPQSMCFLGVILGNCSNLVTLDLSFNLLGEQGGIVLFKNLIRLKDNSKYF